MPSFSPNAFRQLDYGAAIQSGNTIKRQRVQNQLLGQDLEERQEILRKREESKRIRMTYERMPEQIEQLEASGLFDEAANMRQSYVQSKTGAVKMLEDMRRGINADNYDQLRQDLIQSGAVEPELMPAEYSDEWFDHVIREERGKLKKFTVTRTAGGKVMSQDQLLYDVSGEVSQEGTPYEAAADVRARVNPGGRTKSDSDKGPKAADENAILRAIGIVFDSPWDPITEKFAGLEKDQGVKLLSIGELASVLYKDGGRTRLQAAGEAARRSGVNVRDIAGSDDPLGLFKE